jgi:hypothetical protein
MNLAVTLELSYGGSRTAIEILYWLALGGVIYFLWQLKVVNSRPLRLLLISLLPGVALSWMAPLS